jgi:hypothetical protein
LPSAGRGERWRGTSPHAGRVIFRSHGFYPWGFRAARGYFKLKKQEAVVGGFIMSFSKTRKISIVITVLLFSFFLFANIYAIRRMGHYGVELYLYDKLLVAYQVGGMPGMKEELERILSQDKMPHEIAEAKAFKKNLDSLEAPDKYLRNAVGESKNKINLFRNLRNIAFACITLLVLIRAALNLRL